MQQGIWTLRVMYLKVKCLYLKVKRMYLKAMTVSEGQITETEKNCNVSDQVSSCEVKGNIFEVRDCIWKQNDRIQRLELYLNASLLHTKKIMYIEIKETVIKGHDGIWRHLKKKVRYKKVSWRFLKEKRLIRRSMVYI